jgi:TnpA family transposase
MSPDAKTEQSSRQCRDRRLVGPHGASLVGFAFTELLGFKLLPQLKNIGAIQLYAPDPNQAAWPRLEKILKKRPIDWELIARNYDQMLKYAHRAAAAHGRDRPGAAPLHQGRRP